MTLINVNQLKIPFQAVIRYLRVFEPGSQVAPEAWAQRHAEDIAPGDVLFIWEVLYSPWGDSTAGIGVADGDSFRLVQLFLVTKWDNGTPFGYIVGGDTFESHTAASYFTTATQTAKEGGVGYYYSIVRPKPPLNPDRLREVAALESTYGSSGWRSDDAALPDIPFAFFQAAGYGVEAKSGVTLDITSLGYALFCDKEPPPGMVLPDLRPYTAPVYRDARREATNGDGAAEPRREELPAAEAPPPPSNLPKMPSFFSLMGGKKNTDGQKTGNPLAAPNIFGGPVPPEPPPWVGNEEDAPKAEEQEVAPWGTPVDVITTTEPAMPPDALPTLDQAAPSIPDLPTLSPPSMKGPKISAPRPGGHLPPVPSRGVPPLPTSNPQLSLPFVESNNPPPAAEVQLGDFADEVSESFEDQNVTQEIAAFVPADGMSLFSNNEPQYDVGLPPETAEAQDSPPPVEPAAEDEAASDAPAPDAPQHPSYHVDRPYLNEPAPAEAADKGPGVEDIMAAIETSIRESAAAKKQEESAESAAPAPRVRPGRGGAQQAQPAAESTPEPVKEEAPAQTGSDAESSDAPPQIAPFPPKKKKVEVQEPARAQEMQNRAQLKEPMAVKSGVAGLVSKLEQQASRASARLEQQVDEIQNRLTEETNRLTNKVNASEKRAAKSAEGLRINLTSKMDGATAEVKGAVHQAAMDGTETIRAFDQTGAKQLDDKHEYLRTSLSGAFDEVRARAQTVSKAFEETLEGQSKDVLSNLEDMREQVRNQFTELETHYDEALQSVFDTFKEKLNSVSKAAGTALETRHDVLEAQLKDLRKRQLNTLEHTKRMLLSRLSKQLLMSEMELSKLQASSLEESVMPKLKQHREELRVVTTEFQSKLAEDLDQKGLTKVEEFQPILEEKKDKLLDLLKDTNTVKDAIQEQLRTRLESIFQELKAFVDSSLEDAQTAFKSTEEQLADIDRAVRALADPSTIEGDVELLNERNEVLTRLDEITEKAKDDVLNTLRASVASLEERGKHLQEELISSMEEDAYQVRRASEQSLIAIREAIRDSFFAIQSAQDERMPM